MLTFQIEVTFLKPKYPRSLQTLKSVVTLTVKPQFLASHSPFVFFKGSPHALGWALRTVFYKADHDRLWPRHGPVPCSHSGPSCFWGFAAGPNHHHTISVACCWGFPVLKRGECLFHLFTLICMYLGPEVTLLQAAYRWVLLFYPFSHSILKKVLFYVAV